MKAVKGIVVELKNKVLDYNGIAMEYDFVNKVAKTLTFKEGIALPSDYDSPNFTPDRGIVVDSDDPQIEVGDEVVLDYFATVKKLGRSIEQFQKDPHDIHFEDGGKVLIPVKTRMGENYVYGMFRDGEFVQYDDWCIVRVITEKRVESSLILISKDGERLTDEVYTNECVVLHGSTELVGKRFIYDARYLLGRAQRSLVGGALVHFIQEEHLLCEVS